ncbi:T9SS type A sorting domain-containing protein [bacterium]|nr:T9SS type A sorting domain-containing protein [bacterium]
MLNNNRKWLICIIIFIIWFSRLWALNTDQKPSLEENYSAPDQVSLSYSGTELRFLNIHTENGMFTQLLTASSHKSDEIGAPELPVLRALIQIPFGATPSITISNTQFAEYDCSDLGIEYPVFPKQEPVIKRPGGKPEFLLDQKVYSTDSYQFEQTAGIVDEFVLRCYNIALIEIHNVDYNPVRNKVKVLESAEITIQLSGSDMQLTRQIKSRYYSPVFENLALNTILNPMAYLSPEWVPSLDIGYIIIYDPSFASAVSNLAAWKARKGYKVYTKTDTELGGTASGVKNYIQTQYDSGEYPPDFVLLVGDVGNIPTYTGSASGSASDLPYSLMAGSDYIPDLMIGRLSISSSSEVTEMANRIVEYEQCDYTSLTWTNRAAFLASDDGSFWDLAEATHRYAIQTWFGPAGFQCDSIWAHSGGDRTDVINAVNNGRMIVNYSGHGTETAWDAPALSQSNIEGLSNNNMYPFVISNACLTGRFSRTECFGETWIRQTNKGAIAFFGASNYSYWNEDDELERRMYDAVFDDDYYLIGSMTQQGLYGVYLAYTSSAEYYYDMYNILGDPSVALWFRTPAALSVTHPSTIPVGSSIIHLTVTSGGSSVRNALVCITNDSDIHETGYTNVSGAVDIPVVGAAVGETLWVTATAYNKQPYFGHIVVTGTQPYLAYESGTVNDDEPGPSAGDADGIIDIGETIEFSITLRNVGTVTAEDVNGILTTSDPYITITDGNNNFGDIPAASTRTSLNPYIFNISPNTPDGHEVQFELEATDAEDSTWILQFTLDISAPVLNYQSHLIADPSPGGDADGFPEPGESFEITVTLINDGGETARSIVGVLGDLSDPYITVDVTSSPFANTDPSETQNSSHVYDITVAPGCPSPHTAYFEIEFTTAIGYTSYDTFSVLIGEGGLSDDVESGTGPWTYSGWHISDFRSNSPGHSWYSGSANSHLYPDETISYLTTPSVVLSPNSYFSFWHFFVTETGYDSCIIQVNTGSGWSNVHKYTGFRTEWDYELYDLTALASGTEIQFRFKFKSDTYVHGEGWYVDDIYIGPLKVAELGAGSVYPIAGHDTTNFNFSVTYFSLNDYEPTSKKIVLDGTHYDMTTDDFVYNDGSVFTYSTTTRSGIHVYHFEFTANGQLIRFPRTGEIIGPYVDENLYSYNIGSSPSGFTTAGSRNDWEWGVPTSGPGSAPFGSNVWATNLDGNYRDSSKSQLLLPPMDLTEVSWAFLRFAHWYEFQPPNYYGYHDGGNLKIVVDSRDTIILYPQEYYDVILSQYNHWIPWQLAYADDDNGNYWHFSTVDLRPYCGNNVRIIFEFGSSSSNVDPGWYVSNMQIIGSEDVGIETEQATGKLPRNLSINQNYPNPFNYRTVISYAIPAGALEKSNVDIQLFDILGNSVKTLENGEKTPGFYEVAWDGLDDKGNASPSGIYFCRISNGVESKTISLLLIR